MDKIKRHTPIAIIGAGIAGLSLAISLTQNQFYNIVLFQKDQAFQSRRQGYALTILQAKTALKKLGVFEEAKIHNAPSRVHYTFDEKGSILGLYGTIFWDHKNEGRSLKQRQKGLSMHIPRQALRKVLMDRYMQLKSSASNQNPTFTPIMWNCGLKKINLGSSLELDFENGIKHKSDLVFGCDGIYSSVRNLSHKQPETQPLTFLKVMIVLGLCHSSHPLTNQTIFQTRNGVYRFYSMPFGGEHELLNTMWQLSFMADKGLTELYKQQPQKLKQWLQEELQNWHQPIPSMIKSTLIANFMSIAAYDRPATPPTLKDQRIVLIGDSLHPMSPFKSQGANQALLNAVHVGQMLSKHGADGLAGIHSELMMRTGGKMGLSRQRIDSYHSKDYNKIEQYLYPPISKQLMMTLEERGLNANSINLQQNIIQIIKQLKY